MMSKVRTRRYASRRPLLWSNGPDILNLQVDTVRLDVSLVDAIDVDTTGEIVARGKGKEAEETDER